MDFIQICIFRGCTVGSFKDGMAGGIVNIGSRCNPDPTHQSGNLIRYIITLQIHGGNNILVKKPGNHGSQSYIGDGVHDKHYILPLVVSMCPPQFQSLLHFMTDILLLLRRQEIEARENHPGIVFNRQVGVDFFVSQNQHFALGDDLVPEFALRQGITPNQEGAYYLLEVS